MPASDRSEASVDNSVLARRLTLWSASAAAAGVVIGSGIYRTPTALAGLLGSPGAMVAVWALGGLLALCLVLLLAELGAMYPRAGGLYVFLREAYGDLAGFLYGWTFLIVNPAAWATIAAAAAEFIAHFLPMSEGQRRLATMGVIVALSIVNVYSAKAAAAVQGTSTGAKVLGLVAVVLLLAIGGSGAHGAFAAGAPVASAPLSAWLLALVAVLWAYDGFASYCSLAGEIRDPQRTLPLSLLIGIGAVMLLYVGLNAAMLYVLPVSGVAGTPLPLADAVGTVIGPRAADLVAALVVLSTLSSLAACALADPRVFFAMARDGNFFARIGAVHPRNGTPANAILMHCVLACLYASARSFEQLAATFILGIVPFYTLAAFAVWRLRRTRPQATRPFRTPAAPLLIAVWTAAAVLMMGYSFVDAPVITGMNLLLTAAGVPVYWLWRRLRRPAAPAPAPG